MSIKSSAGVNLEAAIDTAPLTRLQSTVFAFCALMMFVDGFDLQTLALTVPYIARDWGIAPTAFAFALSASPLAMGIGGGLLAPLGDRFGRKPLLLSGLALVGVSTFAIAFARDPVEVGLLRLVTGAGMGVVAVNALTLTGEYAPARNRFRIMALMSSALALGAFVAALFSPLVILENGWRSLYLIGGVAPLALAVWFAAAGPESIKWLVARDRGHGRIAGIARRLFPETGAALLYVPDAPRGGRRSILALLAPVLRIRTLVVWFACSTGGLAVYLLISWLPTLLLIAGWPDANALHGAAAFQFGGVIGSITIAWLVDRGRLLAGLAWGYAGAMLSMLAIGLGLGGLGVWLALLVFIGAGTAGMQVIWMSIATVFYPLDLRSTSAGWTSAVSRVGAIAAPYLGSAAIAAGFGLPGIMLLLLIPLGLSAAAVAAGRRQFGGRGEAARSDVPG